MGIAVLALPLSNMTTTVSVLNPGFWPAEVTVSFHKGGPDVYTTNEETIPAQSIAIFQAPADPDLGSANGWVEISSDGPVLPWGYISYGGGQDGIGATQVQMTFGRCEWVPQIPRVPLP